MLPIDLIDADPDPLREIDGGTINDLRISIKKVGVLQPILVRPIQDRYRIVFGNHRYYGAKGAELTEIPAIIRDLSSDEARLLSLTENIQRLEMNPVKEGEAYQKLLSSKFYSTDDLAEAIGKSPSHIKGRIKLYTDLHPQLKNEIGKTLTITNAIYLSKHTRNHQLELFEEIKKGKKILKIHPNKHGFGFGGFVPVGTPSFCICPRCGAKHLKGIGVVSLNELK